jgi:branched-chain amino acid transport system permease protein
MRRLARQPLPVACALAAIALLVFPAFMEDYSLALVQKILIFAILAISLDLIYGYAGLPSLGQAAFLGVGGYAAAILMLKADIATAWLVVPGGIAAGAIAAAIFGPIVLRTTGLNFLLVTFAIGQLLSTVALKWSFLHSFGVEGLVGVTFPSLGFEWDVESMYYAVVVTFAAAFAVAMWITRSPLGYAAIGVRENEQRMRVLGYNTFWVKYKLFILSGALAAVAGQLLAFTSGTVLPTNLDITYSALVFLMVVLAGAGTIYGPVLGAAAIVLLEYYVSNEIPDRWPLVLGAIFLITAVFSRDGFVGMFSRGLAAASAWLAAHTRWRRPASQER